MFYRLFVVIACTCMCSMLHAQVFLNGSFENNTASGCNYLLNNTGFNALMSNSRAFGDSTAYDILYTNCSTVTPTQGVWCVGLHRSNLQNINGKMSLELSTPLVAGNSYTLSFKQQADINYSVADSAVIGLSANDSTFGTLLYSSVPQLGSWSVVTYTFTAPFSASYITLKCGSFPGNCILYFDEFTISQNCPSSFSLGNDTLLCSGRTTLLSNPVSNSSSYWYNSSISNSILISQPDTVWLNASVIGCPTISDTIIITYTNIVPVISTTVIQHEHCFGDSIGTASATATGGTGTYNFAWQTLPIQTNDTAYALPAGNYNVIVTDNNLCADTGSVIINQPPAIVYSYSVVNQVVCNGQSNGNAYVQVNSGGVPPFSYSWSTSPTQQNDTAFALPAGNYIATITDGTGCMVSTVVPIVEPNALYVNAGIVSNVTCAGLANGSLGITTAGGGTLPYSISWNTIPVQTSANISNLQAGTYIVTLTDTHFCVTTDTVVLINPIPLSSQIVVNTNVLCNGDSTGATAAINTVGGTGSYSYSWNTTPLQTTSVATNLTAGTYTCTVSDQNNCTYIGSVVLTQPAAISNVIASTSQQVNCNGGSDGIVTCSLPVGGTPNYSFSWSTVPVQLTQSVTNLLAGTYTVTVTDQHGCTKQDSTIVTQPTALSNFSVTTFSNAACVGVNNGSASASTPIGGTPPYSYSWNTLPVQSTQIATNLPLGLYVVTATDQHNCSITANVQIGINGGITIHATGDNVNCAGASDGNVFTSITGGTAPFSYGWNVPSTSSQLNNVAIGYYLVQVIDALGCSDTDGVTITEPFPIILNLYSPTFSSGFEVSGYGKKDGTIFSTASGGVYPYKYAWSNGEKVPELHGLSAGTYMVTLTDSLGCTVTDSIILHELQLLELPTGFTPNGDGKNDLYIIHGIEGVPQNLFTVFNRWGNKVYEQEDYQNNWAGISHLGIQLPTGTYFVVLKDDTGKVLANTYIDLRR